MLWLLFVKAASASYAFYVGKNLTANKATLIGGTGEEVSSHSLKLVPAQDHPANATITVGVTDQAVIPGQRITIPQVSHTYRYMSMEYSDYEGFPAPLTNGGVNEMGVGVRDVWASNRQDLVDMTPTPQRGVQYSDLARIVMERASSARHGVEIIGDLIAKHGYATYGGNTHLIADKNEGWVVWEFAGGQKLWAAERLGENDIRVLYPGYIEDFPVDYANHTSGNYVGSPNLVSFAVDQGWWHPDSGKPFNIFNVYGIQGPEYKARDGGFKYMSQARLENLTRAMVPVSEKDLMERVRDYRIADDSAGYGQVLSLEDGIDADLQRIWIAPTGSVTAPFIPWWLGVNSVPPEFSQHRYLTDEASSTFLNPDYQLQEASLFAGRLFKRVMYYTCSAPNKFMGLVQKMLVNFEGQSRDDLDWVQDAAKAMISGGKRDGAKKLLTHYSHTRAEKALSLGKTLTDSMDAYIKLTGTWEEPKGDQINLPEGDKVVTCLKKYNPDKPPDQQ